MTNGDNDLLDPARHRKRRQLFHGVNSSAAPWTSSRLPHPGSHVIIISWYVYFPASHYPERGSSQICVWVCFNLSQCPGNVAISAQTQFKVLELRILLYLYVTHPWGPCLGALPQKVIIHPFKLHLIVSAMPSADMPCLYLVVKQAGSSCSLACMGQQLSQGIDHEAKEYHTCKHKP